MTVNGPIYLIKEDGVVSEQTFFASVHSLDAVPPGSGFNPAQLNIDYSLGVAGRVITPVLKFPTSDQRIVIPITLFSDNFPEGTEAFHINVTPADHVVVDNVFYDDIPTYLRSEFEFEAFVNILDDESKLYRAIGYLTNKYIIL